MATKPRFEEGDYVVLKADPDGWTWQILERKGKRYLVGDVGYETSNIIKEWRNEDELEIAPDDDEDFEPSESSPLFCDWEEDSEEDDPFSGFWGE